MKNFFQQFDLFCFDFDGLLVDSERIHKKAFDVALGEYNLSSEVDFYKYCSFAHHPTGTRLKDLYMGLFPSLKETLWQNIIKKKKKHYTEMLSSESLTLMPGAQSLIEKLKEEQKKLCVVTNSPLKDTKPFRDAFPVLDEIPLWITADDTRNRKPHPDGYLKALVHYAEISASRAVGLEDALKGVTALKNANITPLLVCDSKHPQLSLLKEDVKHIETLETLLT